MPTDHPPPLYNSWGGYIAQVPITEILAWCATKAKKANKDRFGSARVGNRISRNDVLVILENAQGRCHHCNSLAVENRPSVEKGKPDRWASVGRRIGSLDHLQSRFEGGSNELANLAWCCLWCNTWPRERVSGAINSGGLHPPPSPFEPIPDPDRSARIDADAVRETAN